MSNNCHCVDVRQNNPKKFQHKMLVKSTYCLNHFHVHTFNTTSNNSSDNKQFDFYCLTHEKKFL